MARNAPPKPAMPICAPETISSYRAGSVSEMRSASTGPIPAAIATMASGKMMRMPNTAMTMPQVRKRCCHTALISPRTEALTTALSNESEISRTDSMATTHSIAMVAATEPVWNQP